MEQRRFRTEFKREAGPMPLKSGPSHQLAPPRTSTAGRAVTYARASIPK